jgi:hypothetical protein
MNERHTPMKPLYTTRRATDADCLFMRETKLEGLPTIPRTFTTGCCFRGRFSAQFVHVNKLWRIAQADHALHSL